MQTEIVDLGLPSSSNPGTAILAARYGAFGVTVEAIGGGTVQIQVSNDPTTDPTAVAAGSWVSLGSALAAAGTATSAVPFRWVRGVVAGYTGGTPKARLCGLTSHQGGVGGG
jgi:hypothetical protein